MLEFNIGTVGALVIATLAALAGFLLAKKLWPTKKVTWWVVGTLGFLFGPNLALLSVVAVILLVTPFLP